MLMVIEMSYLEEQVPIFIHPEVPRIPPAPLLAHDDCQALVEQDPALVAL